MKALILLFTALFIGSCSSDDENTPIEPQQTVDVTSHSYTVFEASTIGYRMTYTAAVKNNKTTPVTGRVRFSYANGTGSGYDHILNVSLNAGENKTVTALGSHYYPSDEVVFTEVKFIEN